MSRKYWHDRQKADDKKVIARLEAAYAAIWRLGHKYDLLDFQEKVFVKEAEDRLVELIRSRDRDWKADDFWRKKRKCEPDV